MPVPDGEPTFAEALHDLITLYQVDYEVPYEDILAACNAALLYLEAQQGSDTGAPPVDQVPSNPDVDSDTSEEEEL